MPELIDHGRRNRNTLETFGAEREELAVLLRDI